MELMELMEFMESAELSKWIKGDEEAQMNDRRSKRQFETVSQWNQNEMNQNETWPSSLFENGCRWNGVELVEEYWRILSWLMIHLV